MHQSTHGCPLGLAAALALTPALAAEIIVPVDLPLGAAVSLAADGETITFMPGVYDGSQGFTITNKTLTIRSFSGNPADTIIDGFGVGRILDITGAGSDGTVLRGLGFRNGDVDLASATLTGGGAVRIDGADVTIENCVFENNAVFNSASDVRGGAVFGSNGNVALLGSVFRDNAATSTGGDGGAVYLEGAGSSHLLHGCVFEANGALNSAGALRIDQSTAQITACHFEANAATGDPDVTGGGVFARFGATMTFDGCTFRDNFSSTRGGAISTLDAATSVTVRNSVFQRNDATTNGGAIHSGSPVSVVNCTFEGNTSATCAVLCGSAASVVTMDNSVLWNNQPSAGQLAGGSITVAYSVVQGGFAGPGNLNANPMFVAAGSDDLSLLAGSPASDAGSSSRYSGPFVDLAGNDRAVDDPGAPDSGEAIAGPIVDMGAHEMQAGAVPSCPGDVDGDGAVGITDLLQMLGAWGVCP